MLAILKREIKSYFYSPIAYVLIGLFILLSAIVFLNNLFSQYAEFNNVLSFLGVILLFIVPILTMRSVAEDRKNGTDVLLITSPTSLTNVVLAKYFGALIVFLVMTAITVIFPIITIIFGDPPIAQLIGGYVGFILLGASFISVGVFASSLTENQIVAAVISFVSLLIMWLLDGLSGVAGGVLAIILSWLSLLSRYTDFNSGIFSISPVIYYLSFIAVFIFLTVRDRKSVV